MSRADGRVVHQQMADHQHPPARLGQQRASSSASLHRQRDGLLHENVAAGQQARPWPTRNAAGVGAVTITASISGSLKTVRRSRL
ncbi:MAG: hypothetical protein V9H69_17840 [Anaerolineae bacterium]